MKKIDEYKALLKSISSDLQRSEDMLKKIGYNTPVQYPILEGYERISFPTGYIRREKQFENIPFLF